MYERFPRRFIAYRVVAVAWALLVSLGGGLARFLVHLAKGFPKSAKVLGKRDYTPPAPHPAMPQLRAFVLRILSRWHSRFDTTLQPAPSL